jgi:hypothetical protein
MVETPPFKLTRLIGGKLRALYDEEALPCPSRLDDLLETLASAKSEPPLIDRPAMLPTHPPVKAATVTPVPGTPVSVCPHTNFARLTCATDG